MRRGWFWEGGLGGGKLSVFGGGAGEERCRGGCAIRLDLVVDDVDSGG